MSSANLAAIPEAATSLFTPGSGRLSITFPPYNLVLSSLRKGASCGAMIVHFTLFRVAAKDSACAKFPLLKATTPLLFCSSVKLMILLVAPRNLKAPVRV